MIQARCGPLSVCQTVLCAKAMEAERTRVGVARERMLVTQQEAQTEQQRAIMMVQTWPSHARVSWGRLLAVVLCDRGGAGAFLLAMELVDEELKHALTSGARSQTIMRRGAAGAGPCWQAETEAQRSRIHMAQVLAEREAEQKQEAIQDEIMLARRRAEADAEYYRCMHAWTSLKRAGGRINTPVACLAAHCASGW